MKYDETQDAPESGDEDGDYVPPSDADDTDGADEEAGDESKDD